jgi:hypothetical protein
MFAPEELARCVEGGIQAVDADAARELARLSKEIEELEEKRQDLFRSYAAERISSDQYIGSSRSLDEAYVQLKRKKAALSVAVRRDAGGYFGGECEAVLRVRASSV